MCKALKERLREFSLAIIAGRKEFGWDFNWIFQTHASASLDRDVLALVKSAGCYCFTYGLESASPRVLASMNKRTKLSQIIEILDIGSSVGLGFYAAFIYGDPAETADTISESMNFFSRYCLDKHIGSNIIYPYPGSALFKYCQEKGIIRDKLEFYEHIDEHPVNMTSMPDRLWYPWASLLLYLQKFCQWVKSTDATYCTKDTEDVNDPVATYYKMAIYNIGAKCPYCGKDVQYREMMTDTSVAAEGTGLGKPWFFFRQFRIALLGGKADRYKLRIIAKGAFLLLTSFWHPLFKSLKPFIGENDFVPSITTGCLHCNKRIKINIPGQGDAHNINRVMKLLKKLL